VAKDTSIVRDDLDGVQHLIEQLARTGVSIGGLESLILEGEEGARSSARHDLDGAGQRA
jgi:hypothetical protein